MRKILLVVIFVISLFAVNSMTAKWMAGSDTAIMSAGSDTASTRNVRIVSVEEVDTTKVTDLLITRDDEECDTTQVTDLLIIWDDDYDEATEQGSGADDRVYTVAMLDEKPEFPGGQEAMYRWLADHISYPEEASRAGAQGRVVLEFTINKTGDICDIRILRSRHPALDAEAVRLVRSMPRWKPGRKNGEPVIVTYTLPINFKLAPETQDNTSTSNSSNALFSEKDLKDAAMFREYGQKSLAAGDNSTAIKYFEESFRIVPTQSELITICDSICGLDRELREQVFDRAADALLSFMDSHVEGDLHNVYLSAVMVFEKLGRLRPSDISVHGQLQFFYYSACDPEKAVKQAQYIYNHFPSINPQQLLGVVWVDVFCRFYLKDYQGIVNIALPRVDICFEQAGADFEQCSQIIQSMIYSYAKLGKDKEARKLMKRIQSEWPDVYTSIYESFNSIPEMRGMLEGVPKP